MKGYSVLLVSMLMPMGAAFAQARSSSSNSPSKLVVCKDGSKECVPLPTQPELILGATADDLHRAWGRPSWYYDASTKQILANEEEAQIARRVSGDLGVEDVYEIKTALNTYELTVRYYYDARQSRLRPTKRSMMVLFELDKPVEDIRVLLADFPLAVSFCSQECFVFKSFYHLEEQWVVRHTGASSGEIVEAGLLETGWSEDVPLHDYVKVLRFSLNSRKQIESGSFFIDDRVGEGLMPYFAWQSSSKQE